MKRSGACSRAFSPLGPSVSTLGFISLASHSLPRSSFLASASSVRSFSGIPSPVVGVYRRALGSLPSATRFSQDRIIYTPQYRRRQTQFNSATSPSPLLHFCVRYATESPAAAPTENKENKAPETEEKNEGRIKAFIRKYGPVGVVTYFAIYGVTLGSFYMAFASGLIVTADVTQFLEHIPLHEYFDLDPATFSSKVGSFASAWIVTKLTEPVRLGLTMFVTPWIRNFLVRRGLMKGPPPRPRRRDRKNPPTPPVPASPPPASPPSNVSK